MQKPEQGFAVKDIRGRSLGQIAAVRGCCLQLSDGRGSFKPDAVLSVGQFGVELICDAEQLSRYACQMHTAAHAGK
jgi:hypothetical protein